MAFRDFTFPKVVADLGLNYHEDHSLFSGIAPVELPAPLLDTLENGRYVTQRVDNEKARSEFMIAPLLLAMWAATGRKFGLFSGSAFDADPARGLNGYVDFLIARDPMVSFIKAPVAAIVEAKNDNVWNGYAQSIATMAGAVAFNGGSDTPVYGASTTGVQWKFFRLVGAELWMDVDDYFYPDIRTIAAILFEIAGVNPAPWPLARPELARA